MAAEPWHDFLVSKIYTKAVEQKALKCTTAAFPRTTSLLPSIHPFLPPFLPLFLAPSLAASLAPPSISFLFPSLPSSLGYLLPVLDFLAKNLKKVASEVVDKEVLPALLLFFGEEEKEKEKKFLERPYEDLLNFSLVRFLPFFSFFLSLHMIPFPFHFPSSYAPSSE